MKEDQGAHKCSVEVDTFRWFLRLFKVLRQCGVQEQAVSHLSATPLGSARPGQSYWVKDGSKELTLDLWWTLTASAKEEGMVEASNLYLVETLNLKGKIYQ